MRKRHLFPFLIALAFVGVGCAQQAGPQAGRGEKTNAAKTDAETGAIISDVSAEDALNEEEAKDADDVTSDNQEITTYGSADYEIK